MNLTHKPNSINAFIVAFSCCTTFTQAGVYGGLPTFTKCDRAGPQWHRNVRSPESVGDLFIQLEQLCLNHRCSKSHLVELLKRLFFQPFRPIDLTKASKNPILCIYITNATATVDRSTQKLGHSAGASLTSKALVVTWAPPNLRTKPQSTVPMKKTICGCSQLKRLTTKDTSLKYDEHVTCWWTVMIYHVHDLW